MAKLSTTYHTCEVTTFNPYDGQTRNCGSCAYQRHNDRYLCKKHLRESKAQGEKFITARRLYIAARELANLS